MFKKVILIISLLYIPCLCFSKTYPGFRYGISLGFFYTEHQLISEDSTIEKQVDSITLFMVNMKLGGLLRLGYHFNDLVSVGGESGILFNNYHINIPLRFYGKLGSSSLNIKGITGISFIREKTYTGNGAEDIGNGLTYEYGLRLEIMHIYLEVLKSHSMSFNFSDSTKISFGYSLFFSNFR